MKTINNTNQTELEILSRTQVGQIKNNWRQRNVYLYPGDLPNYLYMVGKTFDGSTTIITHEEEGMNERQAKDYWRSGKILVRD